MGLELYMYSRTQIKSSKSFNLLSCSMIIAYIASVQIVKVKHTLQKQAYNKPFAEIKTQESDGLLVARLHSQLRRHVTHKMQSGDSNHDFPDM